MILRHVWCFKRHFYNVVALDSGKGVELYHPPTLMPPSLEINRQSKVVVFFLNYLFFLHHYIPFSLKVLCEFCWDYGHDESHQVPESLACPAADDMSVLSAEDFRCRGAPGATWGSQPPRW